jgi:hypothetical protein
MWMPLLLLLFVGSSSEIPPQQSVVASVGRITSVPGFSFTGHAQRDSSGNLYFLVSPPDGTTTPSFVMKIDSDDKPSFFRPESAPTRPDFEAFQVLRNGSVWILSQVAGSAYVSQFNPTGGAQSRSELRLPSNLLVRTFAVSPEEKLLIAGFFAGHSASGARGTTFAAIYDGTTGQVLRELPELSNVPIGLAVLAKPHDNAVAIDDDGNFVLAFNGQLYAITPRGDVHPKSAIPRPSTGVVVNALEASQKETTVQFRTLDPKPQISFVRIDSSGRVIQYQKPSEALGNNVVLSPTGYTFVRFENGKLKLVNAE